MEGKDEVFESSKIVKNGSFDEKSVDEEKDSKNHSEINDLSELSSDKQGTNKINNRKEANNDVQAQTQDNNIQEIEKSISEPITSSSIDLQFKIKKELQDGSRSDLQQKKSWIEEEKQESISKNDRLDVAVIEMDINGNSPLNADVQSDESPDIDMKQKPDSKVTKEKDFKPENVNNENAPENHGRSHLQEKYQNTDKEEVEDKKIISKEHIEHGKAIDDNLNESQSDKIIKTKQNTEMGEQKVEEVENLESNENKNMEEEDTCSSTDTSTLANIIVQHVLKTAVSTFQNESLNLSDHDMSQEEQKLEDLSDLVIRNETGYKSFTQMHSQLLQHEKHMKESDYGNEQGLSGHPANVVATDIAICMLSDKETESNAITDQIKNDIQEISKHINLNDTTEMEQNIEVSVDITTSNISSLDPSSEHVKTDDRMSSSINAYVYQGQPVIEPLINHPEYHHDDDKKFCRDKSPSDRDCLLLETGNLVTTNKGNYRPERKENLSQTLKTVSVSKENSLDSSLQSHGQHPISENSFCASNLPKFKLDKELSRISATCSNQQDYCHGQHNRNMPNSFYVDKEKLQPSNIQYHILDAEPDFTSFSNQSDSIATQNFYDTEGSIDLLDPSVMVRYQRNVLSHSGLNKLASTCISTNSHVLGSQSAENVPVSQQPGHIPSYKTLNEQQNTWMQMFKTLEEKHQLEMQQQNRRHNEALFNLQQHMEDELFNQQKSFREKLNTHKEALSQSLNYSSSTGLMNQNRFYGNNDSHILQTTDNLFNSPHQTLSYEETFNASGSFLQRQSPSWRQIYREIRGTEVSDDEQPSHDSVRRSLDREFTNSPAKLCQNVTENIQTGQYSKPQTLSARGQPPIGYAEPPRAGVYSSPFPISRGKAVNMQSTVKSDQSITENISNNTSDKMNLTSEQRQSHPQESYSVTEGLNDYESFDDVNLSSSTRFSLREKHARHMADLREYYEKELRDLRCSLLADIAEQSPYRQMSSENRNLVMENRLLKEKIQDSEEELEKLNRKIREMEQRNHGLEVRAHEYSEKYSEAQAKLSNFRNKMEELQFYYREKDETVQQLEYQVKHLNEKARNAQKINQELSTEIQKDRSVLQKISQKYDALEKEHIETKEALKNTECKLYDVKAEIVELKRTISKLELENKRISRENYNLHHLKLQSSSLQNSFEVATSETNSSPTTDSPIQAHNNSHKNRDDTSHLEDNCSRKENRLTMRNSENDHIRRTDRTETLNRSLRSATPKKNGSHYYSEDSDSNNIDCYSKVSPVMRAEQDLYRLRDMMKDVTQSPADPPKLKLKKKFYGSDVKKHNRNCDTRSSNIHRPTKSSPKSKSLRSASPHEMLQKSTRKQESEEKFSFSTSSSDLQRNGVSSRQQPVQGEAANSCTLKSRMEESFVEQKQTPRISFKSAEERNRKEGTLSKINCGECITRPQLEDVFTFMANSSEKSKQMPQKEKIKDRLLSITDLEKKYDDLNEEKRRLEAVLSRIPLHGKGRQEKEAVDDGLDKIERELGSIRMSLKRYNVLKSTI